MELKVLKIPESKSILIPVPSQNVSIENIDQISVISHNNDTYKVFEVWVVRKDAPFPRALFWLATGLDISPDTVWEQNRDSDKIYFFLCSRTEVTDPTEPAKPTEPTEPTENKTIKVQDIPDL